MPGSGYMWPREDGRRSLAMDIPTDRLRAALKKTRAKPHPIRPAHVLEEIRSKAAAKRERRRQRNLKTLTPRTAAGPSERTPART